MTHEPPELETANTAEQSLPPLCLVHYFSEHGPDPPPAHPKLLGRVAGRDGNLIFLEFAAAPKLKSRRDTRKVWDALMLLLIVTCLVGCCGSLSVLEGPPAPNNGGGGYHPAHRSISMGSVAQG